MIETIRVALGGLSANKLRTGLTILGLTIGVGSVIVLIAVGTGSSAAVTNQIDQLGSNVLLVSGAPTIGGLFQRGGGASASAGSGLTVADANALVNKFQAPDVQSSSPVANANSVTLTDGTTTYSPSSFVGTTPSYEAARSYTMAEGSWFTDAEVQNHSRVLVVGPTVVSELFGGADPVGQTIQVNGANFQVIGVTASKGSNGTSNQDDTAIAPLTAVQDTLTGYGNVDQIIVQAKSRGQLNAAQTEVTNILNAARSAERRLGRDEQLQRHQPELDRPGLDREQQGVHHPARRGGRDLAAGRRHRRDEHHAGVGHRAHARDRDPQGGGRPA